MPVGEAVAVLLGPAVRVAEGVTLGPLVRVGEAVGCKTTTVVEPLLSAVVGSNSFASTPLVNVTVPLWLGRNWMLSVAGALTANELRVHVTVLPLRVQPLEALTNVTPVGKVVVTTRPLAKFGPLLVSVRV